MLSFAIANTSSNNYAHASVVHVQAGGCTACIIDADKTLGFGENRVLDNQMLDPISTIDHIKRDVFSV